MANKKGTGVEGLHAHPMRTQMIEAILSGQSARSVAVWMRPPVIHNTISRYLNLYVKPVMANAKKLKALLTPDPDPARSIHVAAPADTPHAPAEPPPPDPVEVAKQAIIAAPILAVRDNRIKLLEDRHRRLQMVMEARAVDMASIPGGDSGLLARDYKGENEVFKLDASLLAEFREHERAVAIESGQWQEQAPPNFQIQIVCPAAPGELPRISYASPDTIDEIEAPMEIIGMVQK